MDYSLRKKSFYRGLAQYPVYLIDNSELSLDYFVLSSVPEELTAGKNIIKILGNPSNLLIDEPVLVEILDCNGQPIYHEIQDYIDRLKRRVISIFVYSDTPAGNARITIIGKAKNVPTKWQNQYNVKWTKTVLVDPLQRNKTEILFNGFPSINITEIFSTYNKINYSNYSGSITSISASEKIDYVYNVGQHIAKNFKEEKTQQTSGKFGVFNSGKNVNLAYNSGYSKQSDYLKENDRSIFAAGGSSIVDKSGPTLRVDSGFKFSDEMIGGQITIPLPEGIFPTTTINQSFDAIITDVLNENTIRIDTPFEILTDTIGTKQLVRKLAKSKFYLKYNSKPVESASQAYRTFAFIEISNLNPIGGDVYRIKTYGKSNSSVTDYELIGNTLVQPNNLLIDTGSLTLSTSIGDFSNLNNISTFWTSSVSLIPSSQNLLHGLEIGGRTKIKNFNVNFFENNEYDLIFNAHSIKQTTDAKLKVFVSGSATGLKLIGTIENKLSSKNYEEITLGFRSEANGIGVPIFEVESGNWTISNVRLQAHYEFGFSPNHFTLALPVTSVWDKNILNFKFELYDYTDNMADQLFLVNNVDFEHGTPSYIQGAYNLITGSQYVGNRLGAGIVISGDEGGYFKSVGYAGFAEAYNNTGAPGFLIWSGSVLETSLTSYCGVGLELIANSGSFFRYRTCPNSELYIRTDSFYLGGPNNYISGSDGTIWIQTDNFVLSGSGVGIYCEDFYLGGPEQYLSGSNGNIEISSSNFYLGPNGDVIARSATLSNYVFSDFIANRVIEITDLNYSQYIHNYTYAGKNWSYLDLGNEATGSAMFIRFETGSLYPITHIKIPIITGYNDIDVGATITVEFANNISAGQVYFYDLGNDKREQGGGLTESNAIHNLSGSFAYDGFSTMHKSVDAAFEYTGSLRSKEDSRMSWTKGSTGWGINSTSNMERTEINLLAANIAYLKGTRRNDFVRPNELSYTNQTGSYALSWDENYNMAAIGLTLGDHPLWNGPGGTLTAHVKGYNRIYGNYLIPEFIKSSTLTFIVYYSISNLSTPTTNISVDWRATFKTVDEGFPDSYDNTDALIMNPITLLSTTKTMSVDNYTEGDLVAVAFEVSNASLLGIASGKTLGFSFGLWTIYPKGSPPETFRNANVKIFGVRVLSDKIPSTGGFLDEDKTSSKDTSYRAPVD